MICQRTGCTQLATNVPVISFAAVNKPRAGRAEAELDLRVCDQHADPSAFKVTDEAWAQITRAIKRAGRAAPDRRTVRVTFRPAEQSAFLSTNARSTPCPN